MKRSFVERLFFVFIVFPATIAAILLAAALTPGWYIISGKSLLFWYIDNWIPEL